MSYQIGSAVFISDTLFAPDVGSARCDFIGGSPEQLFASIQRLLALPEHDTLYLCQIPGRFLDTHQIGYRIPQRGRSGATSGSRILGQDD